MSDYATAWDELTRAIGAAKGESFGSIHDNEHLTVDQRIEVAKVVALLSISQELSAINHGEGKFASMLKKQLDAISDGLDHIE